MYNEYTKSRPLTEEEFDRIKEELLNTTLSKAETYTALWKVKC